jgi:4-diphosphocytidyl-2-C-methyl-D-erythritol kinase
MFLRKANAKWTARAPAKLNVYLAVQGRRLDGYHEIRTLMVPIGLFDSLVVEPVRPADTPPSGILFNLAVPRERSVAVQVPSGDSNLVVRALSALRQRTGCSSGVRVSLTKRIPAAAGLGGGSSDAAAALLAANGAWGLNLGHAELAEIAASLGSDVPFFLHSRAAVCSGRGEVVAPLARSARLNAVVVTPHQRLASREVYAALCEESFVRDEVAETARLARLVRAFERGDVPTISRLLYNGLTDAALSLAPSLGQLAALLARFCGGSAIMSGSGSSFFCLCRTARQARRGAAFMKSLGYESAFAIASYGQ